MTKTTPTKGTPVKKAKQTELPLPACAYAWICVEPVRAYRNQHGDIATNDSFVFLEPTLWLVQKGRKRASFTNPTAAKMFAGKTGKIRAFVEVQA